MKLIEFEPRWIHPNIFVFLCPCCRKVLLSCKNAEMSHREQRIIFEKEFGDGWADIVIWSNPEQSWFISGTIPRDTKAAFITDLTVAPSIDASAAGHWHGNITKGELID